MVLRSLQWTAQSRSILRQTVGAQYTPLTKLDLGVDSDDEGCIHTYT